MLDNDIIAQIESVAAHADARHNTPSVLGRVVDVKVIFDKARLFGQAVYWERCRKSLSHSQHHIGILEAVAACIRHDCGVSREEIRLARLIDSQFLSELEIGTLSLVQALTLLTSTQSLFIVKGLGFSDADITSQKMERFLLQRGDWWV